MQPKIAKKNPRRRTIREGVGIQQIEETNFFGHIPSLALACDILEFVGEFINIVTNDVM